jgi:PAS domain-containing protein
MAYKEVSLKQYTGDLLNLLPTAIFWKNTDGVFVGCNTRFAEISGLTSPEEIIGRADYDMPWGKTQGDAYRKDDFEVIRTKTPTATILNRLIIPITFSFKIRSLDNSRFFFLSSLVSGFFFVFSLGNAEF